MDDRPPNEQPPLPASPRAQEQRGAELRTFLIADIRGYTNYTEEHGDEAATVLAGRFAALVREVVEGREGFLLELRGDEALAVFVSARQALRAANEIQRRTEIDVLPRGVGIGLDAGEALPLEGGFRGSALNLAARLCAQAGPGQIVASEAVIHLAARVDGLAYVDPRTLRLKGLDEPVRAVTVVPEGRTPRKRRRASPLPSIDRRVAIAVGGGGVALAAIGLFAILGGGLPTTPADPAASQRASSAPIPSPTPVPSLVQGAGAITKDELPVMAFLDPETGAVIAKLDQFGDPVAAIYSDGAFWVLDRRPRAIHRVDPATQQVVSQPIALGFEVSAFTIGGGRVWVGEASGRPRIHEFDAASGIELSTFEVDNRRPWYQGIEGLAFDDDSLWVAFGWPGDLARVDPVSHRTLSSVTTDAIGELEIAAGSVWLLDSWRGEVVRIETATNDITRLPVKPGIDGLAVAGDVPWVGVPFDGAVARVEGPNRSTTFPTGEGARFIAVDDTTGAVWSGNYGAGSVSRIDPVTGEVRAFTLGHAVQPLAVGGGVVFAGLNKRAQDIVADLPGSVLRVSTDESFGDNDPAVEGGDFGGRGQPRLQVDQATCARLLDYPTGAAGDQQPLQPSVAAAMPEVTNDGRTYTFQVRPGFAFSPPSNAPLTADTYRYSIERALSPGLNPSDLALGYKYLPEIRGSLQYRNGRSDHVEGLRAEGDRLIIELTRPSPTFLERLWLPYFCPVPIGTPIVPGGINDPPLPRAGRYFIAEHHNEQLTLLQRNPNYPEPSGDAFDWIALFHESSLGRAIGRLERGEVDYVGGAGPELAPGGRIDLAWGPGSEAAAAGNQRLFRQPTLGTGFFVVKSSSEQLASPDVRRAIALALGGGVHPPWSIPSDEILPLSMPGLVDRERFPLDGARVEEARALVGDRDVAVRLAWWHRNGCPECLSLGQEIVRRLGAAGIEVTIEETDDPRNVAGGTDSRFDLAAGYAWSYYPDAAAWLYDAIRAATPDSWMPADAFVEIDRIDDLPVGERTTAAVALADRLANELALIPLDNEVYEQLVSDRVGCLGFVTRQAYLDLAAACPA